MSGYVYKGTDEPSVASIDSSPTARSLAAELQNPAAPGERHSQIKKTIMPLIELGLCDAAIFAQYRGMYEADFPDSEIEALIKWGRARAAPSGKQSYHRPTRKALKLSAEQKIQNAIEWLGGFRIDPADLWEASPVRIENDSEAILYLSRLPDRFRKPVEEIMRHYRVSALLPATCALVINSVALGRGVLTRSNVRRTYPNLYAIIGAQSGSGKSPVFDEFMAPLMEIQKASFKQFNTEQKPRAEAELKLLTHEIQKLAKQGKNLKKFDISEDCRHEKLAELLQQKAELEDQLQFTARLWTEDFTSEALGLLLANNKEQMAVLTDDGGLVIYNLLGRYTDGDVKDDILLCKAKTVSPVPVDRVGRGAILLHQPCVAMLVLTQPDLLHRLFCNERLLMGGFLARCLAADSMMEIQDETEESLPEPDQVIMSQWSGHIQSLVKMFRFSEEPYMIAVAPKVRKLSRQYFNMWAAKARGVLSDVSSFAIRWCERAWEISLNLHTGIHGEECFEPISKETFENAIRISDFFAERQLEVLRRPRIEAQKKQRSRLEEVLVDNHKNPMTLRTLRDRHGIKKEEVISTVKSHPDIFGMLTVDPPHGGSKSTLIFLKSNPPQGKRYKKRLKN
jgi:hypothetical protein